MEGSSTFGRSSQEYGTFQDISKSLQHVSLEERNTQCRQNHLINIERNAMTQEEMDDFALPKHDTDEEFTNVTRKNSHKSKCGRSCCSRSHFLHVLQRLFPILSWLRTYSVKDNLLADITAGFTLCVLQVPQGMAYAMLAVVPPVYGLYTSFFPVLIYFFMGTSKQGSIGTFALVSLLTNSAMEDVINSLDLKSHHLSLTNSSGMVGNAGHLSVSDIHPFTAIEIATVVTFTVGCIELVLGLLRLGTLSVLLSDQLISGLICGTAFQVLTSQMKSLTGVQVQKFSGAFNVIYSWISLCHYIKTANLAIILMSVLSLVCLTVVKWVVDPPFKAKLKIPFPSELLLIIIATSVSYSFNFNLKYDIEVIGDIPTGILPPQMPPIQLIPKAFTGSCLVTLVAISLSLSIVMSYGKKHKYETNSNQELIAYGSCNLFASFFYCIPCSISLSRSAVLDSAGGKSQLATFVSCILLLVVILAVGPVFESLPNCVLSAIIVIALREMFMQVTDLAAAWKLSKADAVVWLSTFLGVIVFDIDYGLGLGIAVALVTVLYRTQRPNTCCLGNICGTEIYKSIKRYPSAREIRGTKIIHFGGPLFFANRETFKSDVQTLCGLDGMRLRSNLGRNAPAAFATLIQVSEKDDSTTPLFDEQPIRPPVKHIIISASAISFIDTAGMNAMIEVFSDCKEENISVFFSEFQDTVFETLEQKRFFEHVPKSCFFPTIHDAVLHAKEDLLNS